MEFFASGLRSLSVGARRDMIEPDHPHLPMTRQCALVGIGRSAFYGGPRTERPA